MEPIRLFENRAYSYSELGLSADSELVQEIEKLNRIANVDLIQLRRDDLRTTQHVGVLRVGRVNVEILPKIDYDGDADAAPGSSHKRTAERSAAENLLHMLSYTLGFPIKAADLGPLHTQPGDWFELLTRLFAQHLHRLVQQGLTRMYVAVNDVLPVMRGRWDVARQLTRRPHLRHTFDIQFDEFTSDTDLNRVFRLVVERLLLLTRDVVSRRLLLDLRDWFSDVALLGGVNSAMLDAVVFTRLNERFRPSFNLSRMFLENTIFQLTAGTRDSVAFVIDMNRLFEQFVSQFLIRHRDTVLRSLSRDIQVVVQGDGTNIYLGEQLPDLGKVFLLRPDIMLVNASKQVVLIADTKYKLLTPHTSASGVAAADMYQLLAYGSRMACLRILGLYPQPSSSLPIWAEFIMSQSHHRVVIATINLRRPLAKPTALVDEMRSIFCEIMKDVRSGGTSEWHG